MANKSTWCYWTSKAFDKLPHECLLLKLHHYSIRGPMLSWIESFLSDRSRKVLVEGSHPHLSVVCTESHSAPSLALRYSSCILMTSWKEFTPPPVFFFFFFFFADDILLYRRIRSEEDHCILQENLKCLEEWEKEWQMSFNQIKCKVIRICKLGIR